MYYNELNERERFYSVAPSDQPPTDQRSQAGHDATVTSFRRIADLKEALRIARTWISLEAPSLQVTACLIELDGIINDRIDGETL